MGPDIRSQVESWIAAQPDGPIDRSVCLSIALDAADIAVREAMQELLAIAETAKAASQGKRQR